VDRERRFIKSQYTVIQRSKDPALELSYANLTKLRH